MTSPPTQHGVDDPSSAAPSGVARTAVGLAGFVVAVVVVSFGILLIAYATGGDDAISDNWVGAIAGSSLIGGLVVSLVAFVLAITARVRHERWKLLWLPLAVFPVLFVAVVLFNIFFAE